jgi:hypothetical protein
MWPASESGERRHIAHREVSRTEERADASGENGDENSDLNEDSLFLDVATMPVISSSDEALDEPRPLPRRESRRESTTLSQGEITSEFDDDQAAIGSKIPLEPLSIHGGRSCFYRCL